MSAVVLRRVSDSEARERQSELAELEREFTYPLGSDRFRIDHGGDYLAFFRGLGAPALLVAEAGGRILGVLVAVLRRVPAPAWYVCDLKVRPKNGFTGLARWLLDTFDRDVRGAGGAAYGISMNPAAGENRLVELARRWPGVEVRLGPVLGIHSFDHSTWQRIAADVVRALGPVAFFDPHGTKDIVLASTGLAMPLLHVQHGPLARPGLAAPRPGSVHMLSLPAEHALATRLRDLGLPSGATASVLHVGMDAFDWSWVLTSDI